MADSFPRDPVAESTALFQDLHRSDRHQIVLAMQRKEVLACLQAINQIWERTDAK
jgi:hypothetical protein